MPTVAFVSVQGGAGRSTLTACFATAAAREGRWSLALEWDPQNTLALHFGAPQLPPAGHACSALQGQAWTAACWRASDGPLVLPAGPLDATARAAWEREVARHPHGLRAALATIERPADGWVFIDTPAGAGPLQDAAVRAADFVVLVLRADALTVPTLARCLALAGERPHGAIVNAFDASRDLQRDVHALLVQRLHGRLAPHPLHRDEMLPEAVARMRAPQDLAPHAQATHDLHGLWPWLRERAAAKGG